MQKRILNFKPRLLVLIVGVLSCTQQTVEPPAPDFSFIVMDVGQGLSQIGTFAGKAMLWDVGDTFAAANWRQGYKRAGSPRIEALVISHTHRDHMGGLSMLPADCDFSGIIVTHPYEDTGYVRRIAAPWRKDISFKIVAQGDTVAGLDGVEITCLWPPPDISVEMPLPDSLKNRFSLCFLLRYKFSSILITSDIDTIAQRSLSARYGFLLASQAIVVPHHGSAGSADEVFYGFVNPSIAIISCGRNNPYGFPTKKVMNLLFQMKVESYVTALRGEVVVEGNGFYWTCK